MMFITLQLLAVALFAVAVYLEAIGAEGSPGAFVAGAVLALGAGWVA